MKNVHGWKSYARKEHRRSKKMLRHTDRTLTIVQYFNSLAATDRITCRQFYAIAKMMKEFPKLFGCVYDTFGYDEVSELLEPIVRLRRDLLNRRRQAMLDSDVYVPSCDMFYAERHFIKICKLYGIEVD